MSLAPLPAASSTVVGDALLGIIADVANLESMAAIALAVAPLKRASVATALHA
jgi:hypothetical protein